MLGNIRCVALFARPRCCSRALTRPKARFSTAFSSFSKSKPVNHCRHPGPGGFFEHEVCASISSAAAPHFTTSARSNQSTNQRWRTMRRHSARSSTWRTMRLVRIVITLIVNVCYVCVYVSVCVNTVSMIFSFRRFHTQ
jgi:hypothetical protein